MISTALVQTGLLCVPCYMLIVTMIEQFEMASMKTHKKKKDKINLINRLIKTRALSNQMFWVANGISS